MTGHPIAPIWTEERRPKVEELLDWLDQFLEASLDGAAADITDAEVENAALIYEKDRLTSDEQRILLDAFAEKENPSRTAGKRGESLWSPLANKLREAPSQRLILVIADLIEFGAFGSNADLAPEMGIRADYISERRAWVLDRLREAYPDVSGKLLLDVASQIVVQLAHFNDQTDRIQDLNSLARDKSRMRLPHLIRSVRTNTWR